MTSVGAWSEWVSVSSGWQVLYVCVCVCVLSKCPCSGTWEPFGGRQLPPSLYTCVISPHPFPTRALVVTLGSFPGCRHLVNLHWTAHHTSLLWLSCENLACYLTTDQRTLEPGPVLYDRVVFSANSTSSDIFLLLPAHANAATSSFLSWRQVPHSGPFDSLLNMVKPLSLLSKNVCTHDGFSE